MSTVSPADAKAHLSKLIDRVEAGETIDITRRGRPVARRASAASARQPVDLTALQKLAVGMAPQEQDAEALVRSMRDSDRY